jgi:hypothetical protein
MQWGSGNQNALNRITTLTKEWLEQNGVTLEAAKAWRDFYLQVAKETPSNPSAAGRAQLMQKAVELLGGS